MSFRKAGAAWLLGGLFVFANLSAHAEVFINEIHYDDATTAGDVGERIEIIATAGEDLSTYKVQLYNGATPTAAAVYGNLDSVPAGSNVVCGSTVRIAVLPYVTNGLQNGANDAIALVNGSGAVVQFLSYEGVATATNGPASGTSSINIPVAESNSTAAGTSLQLGGTGSTYSTFTWNASASDTFGACNNNQVFNLGTPVNILPTVASSDPANNGTYELHPLFDRSLTATFSEPVSIVDAGQPYSLVCNLSGTLAALTANSRPGGPPITTDSITVLAPPGPVGTRAFQIGDVCALTIHAEAFIDSDGAHPATNTVVNFSVVAAPAEAPYVAETFLMEGIPQTRTANYFLRFSEPVTVSSNAFALQCSISGNVTLTFPASGIDYTVSKSINLQNGETCVFTAHAAEITDSDNSHPVQNFVVTFPIAPQAGSQPYVVSTTPANNAVGVPSATDIRVVFSENITADPEAFALQCSASGLIQPGINNSGNPTIILSTNTALQASETCTLTVIAAGIVDGDGVAMTQNYVSHFTIAGNISSYYNRVNTSSAEQLRCSLNTVIRGHTGYPYSAGTTDTWDILEIADEDPNDSGKILDVYRNHSYTKVSSRAGTGSGLTYNREHTWPNSLGFGTDTGNLGLPHAPYTDTHMLYLSDTQYNSDRGNDPYANCTMASGCGERATEVNNGVGGGSGVYPGNSNWTNGSSFETWSKRKGDVARAVMYMAIRYEGGTHTVTGQNEPDLELTDNRSLIVGTSASPAYMGLLTDLLQWHLADPPDVAELARNQVIFSFQGNRNPFIDHPEWATAALFNSSKPATCILNTPSPATNDKYRPILKPRPPIRH